MKTVLITESQAIEALKNDCADFMPYRVLNLPGKILIEKWILNTAKKPHDKLAWFSDAEGEANNSHIDENINIEMGRTMTKSGNPEVLHLGNYCFDWILNE